jgi:hypothetical protein
MWSEKALRFEMGKPTILYLSVYPDGFDPNQMIEDPDFGPLTSDNPWSINLANENAVRLLELLGQATRREYGLGGLICNLAEFIVACDNGLSAVTRSPELDASVGAQVGYSDGFRIIRCGATHDYFNKHISRLRELALIGIEVGGILSFG